MEHDQTVLPHGESTIDGTAVFTIGDERLCPWATVGSDLGETDHGDGLQGRGCHEMRLNQQVCVKHSAYLTIYI